MKLVTLAGCGVLAMVCSGVAMAADLGPPPIIGKAPPLEPYVIPYFSWTGLYVGANVGYGWGNGSGTVTNTTLAPIGASGPVSGSGHGILGGIQLGYNYQMGAWVFGLETDFQGSDGKGSFHGNTGAVTFSGTSKTDWFGTVRARAGYAMDRWLFYVTGGGLYAHSSITGIDSLARSFSASAVGITWTVGAGVEAALWDNWTAKIEYLYAGTPNDVPTRSGTKVSGNVDENIVRAGVNYRF